MNLGEMFVEIKAGNRDDSPANALLRTCSTLLSKNELVDCTLTCLDGHIQAHKIVLASASQYMYDLLTTVPFPTPCTHPMIFLRKSKVEDVQCVLEFMYTGKTAAMRSKLPNILEIAKELEYNSLWKAIKLTAGTIQNKKQQSKCPTNKAKPTKTPNISPIVAQMTEAVHSFNDSAIEQDQEQNQSGDYEILPQQDSSEYYNNDQVTVSDYVKNEVLSEDEDEFETGFHSEETQQVNPLKRSRGNCHEVDEFANAGKMQILMEGASATVVEGNESGDDENEDELDIGFVKPEDLLEIKQDFENEDGTENQSKCPWCNETFVNMELMQQHLKTHVNKYRPFQCEFCQSAFARSAHLKRHLRVHTGEKPYVCSVCQRAFARQDKLKGHMERHLQYAARSDVYQQSSSSNNNDMLSITSMNNQQQQQGQGWGKIPVTVLMPNGKAGHVGTKNANRRFEVGSTMQNGLSISFATSNSNSSEHNNIKERLHSGGVTVTPTTANFSAATSFYNNNKSDLKISGYTVNS